MSANEGSGEDGLKDDVVKAMKVQQHGNSTSVNIPTEVAEDFGIRKGDTVLWLGEAGDDSLQLGKPASVLRSD